MDCENCRYLTVVGLHDTGPWVERCRLCDVYMARCERSQVARRTLSTMTGRASTTLMVKTAR